MLHENDKRYLKLLKQFRDGVLPVRSPLGKMIVCDAMLFQEAEDGGPGSGNFGHEGRPGQVGGSGKGGGKAYRTGNKESGYVSIAKAKAFKSIGDTARNHKDYQSFVRALTSEQKTQIRDQWKQSGTKERFQSYAMRLHQVMQSPPAKDMPGNFKIVQGKDMTADYKWDYKSYTDEKTGQVIDTEIEDVIHKQGFDGLPKVVSQDEFDRIAKEHPEMPILMRSYSAPNADTLAEYDHMLESGAWYIDCGVGGAQYGQGMYTAGSYGENKDIRGVMAEMDHYRRLNEKRAYENYTPDLSGNEAYEDNDSHGIWIWDKSKMQSFGESSRPEDGQEVAIYFPNRSVTRTGVFEGGKLVYPDRLASFSLNSENEPIEWAPIERKDNRERLDAQSSTRMMTLDPSAKIITYNALKALKRGDLSAEEERQVKNDVFEQVAKQKSLTPEQQLMVRFEAGIIRNEEERKQAAEQMTKYFSMPENREKTKLRKILEDAEYETRWGAMKRVEKMEDERANAYRNFTDIGSFAAALGYDAINAETHGDSGSYTVVLNRTKVILSNQRVRVGAI